MNLTKHKLITRKMLPSKLLDMVTVYAIDASELNASKNIYW